jgi:carboxylate-amine ligase
VPAEPPLSDDPRYRRIGERFGRIGRTAGTLGMHVHVDIASDEEGVRVLDRLRPWLPVLVALTANSPYARNGDTGYASWRQLVWSRWPSAGPAEPFGSVAEYRRVSEALVASGAALDDGGLYFDARLAAQYPTVEIRVADVCTDVDDALLVAALCRGLVETLADEPTVPELRSDLLRAASWRAARYGTDGELVHPVTGALTPAADVIAALVDRVGPALDRAGDLDLVADGVTRIATVGTGARRQRHAFETTGDLAGVVLDAVDRTVAQAG